LGAGTVTAVHWLIFSELKKFVNHAIGPGSWEEVIAQASTQQKQFVPGGEYADADAVAIVTHVSNRTQKSVEALLGDFGEFIVPDLINFYGVLMKPSWRTLEVVLNTESMIHAIIRLKDPSAKPPEIHVERRGTSAVQITYGSPRRLCAVAKGIVRGVARAKGETVNVEEKACMHQGAPQCRILLTVS
jgi:hypothetical protein